MTMNRYIFILSYLSLIRACDIFIGMTCTCYESIDLRCTMLKLAPLTFQSTYNGQTFQSIDIKFSSDELLEFQSDSFNILNQLFSNRTQQPLSITLRFQNFYSFHARSGTFRSLFQYRSTSYSRLTLELHPLKAKSIRFDSNTFDRLHLHELSIYADSLGSSFESIFNNTNITHLNIEGAIVNHDSSLIPTFRGHIQSLKMTRMIDTVNSDEFPSFPVQSYTIEAHKMRSLDAASFVNYTQLTGLNLIQPDVSIKPKILFGLEYLTNLRSLSLDAERIADGALKHVKHIQTLILGSYLKMMDSESLTSLQSLRQLDVRYVQFSTLQANTSCLLADFINRKRMLGLTVYLPQENVDCDCVLVFLNTMIDEGDQAMKCQSIHNDRCLFSSCSIVAEYFTRKQHDIQLNTISTSTSNTPSLEFNDHDSPFYPDSKEEIEVKQDEIENESTTVKISMEANIYDDNDIEEDNLITTVIPAITTPPLQTTTTTTTSATTTTTTTTMMMTTTAIVGTTTTMIPLTDPNQSINEFSTPFMKHLHSEPRTYGSANYLIVSWIPFAIIASCLFLSLIIAMISYMIYHKRRTVSFKLVPQTVPII
jgi:hypothetical protein